MIIEKHGNIFTTECSTIVNTINCVGIMGAGIAYEFRLREPDMYKKYKQFCSEKKIDIGSLWIYKSEQMNILNFPTKKHWKFPTKKEYLYEGLQKFIDTYKKRGISSIAFPILGAQNGGISAEESIKIMTEYLSQCDINIEIWHFDPTAKDDIYEDFKSVFNEIDDETIKQESKIRIDIVKKTREALHNPTINSISGLLRVKGIGDATLEKLFTYIRNYKSSNINLFNYEES